MIESGQVLEKGPGEYRKRGRIRVSARKMIESGQVLEWVRARIERVIVSGRVPKK